MPRIHWAVRCHGHHTDGQPCKAWAIRGGYVCKVHGGSLARTRRAAEVRLAELSANRAFEQAWAKYRQRLTDFHVNRLVATSELLGMPADQVTRWHIVMCHAVHGAPPLEDEAPRITDIPIDRRLLTRTLRW